jgi:hypothetical protein
MHPWKGQAQLGRLWHQLLGQQEQKMLVQQVCEVAFVQGMKELT